MGIGDVGSKHCQRRFSAIATLAGMIGVGGSAQAGLDAIETIAPALLDPAVAAFERNARPKVQVAVRSCLAYGDGTCPRYHRAGDSAPGDHCCLILGSAHMPWPARAIFSASARSARAGEPSAFLAMRCVPSETSC